MRLMSTHWAIALACLAASPAFASPTLAGIVGAHAVLQRGQPIVPARAAEPSEAITNSLAGATLTTTAEPHDRSTATPGGLPAAAPSPPNCAASRGHAPVPPGHIG